MLDLEQTDGQSKAAVWAWTQEFVATLKRLTGRPAIMYTGHYFWTGSVGDPDNNLNCPLVRSVSPPPAHPVAAACCCLLLLAACTTRVHASTLPRFVSLLRHSSRPLTRLLLSLLSHHRSRHPRSGYPHTTARRCRRSRKRGRAAGIPSGSMVRTAPQRPVGRQPRSLVSAAHPSMSMCLNLVWRR
jgi:hypothetical protein